MEDITIKKHGNPLSDVATPSQQPQSIAFARIAFIPASSRTSGPSFKEHDMFAFDAFSHTVIQAPYYSYKIEGKDIDIKLR